MAVPTFTMRQLLEAGVHFGHHTRRWNPKMSPYIFGIRSKIHIIDLQQTVPMLYAALNVVRDIVGGGGRVLFVGTKRAASDIVTEAATRCGQYYVNHRWLGGMLTNWKTISRSIKTLKDLDQQLGDDATGLTKKEVLNLTRKRNKLERALGGIKEMGGRPDVLVVIDTNKEAIAVAEARKLGIPVVGVVDSNSDPDEITHPVPGNDDAMRAISLYCELFSGAVIDGLQQELTASGADAGAAEKPPAETVAKPASTPPAAGDAGAAEKPPAETVVAKPASAPPAASVAGAAAKPPAETAAKPASSPPAAGDAGAAAKPPAETVAKPASTPPAASDAGAAAKPPAETDAKPASTPPAASDAGAAAKPPAETAAKPASSPPAAGDAGAPAPVPKVSDKPDAAAAPAPGDAEPPKAQEATG